MNRAAEYNPNAEINTGDQSTQRTFRVSGFYRLPFGIAASANFNSESGAPQSRQVLLRGGAQIPTFELGSPQRLVCCDDQLERDDIESIRNQT